MTDYDYETELMGLMAEEGLETDHIPTPVSSAIRAVEEIRPLDKKQADFRDLVSRYPFEYMVAKGLASGVPEEILDHLHLLKTSDKLKEVLGQFLALFPNGMALERNLDARKRFEEADIATFNSGADLLSRQIVPVNPFSARAVLGQFIPWQFKTPRVEDIESGKLHITTSAGAAVVDFTSTTTLYTSVMDLIVKKHAAVTKFKFVMEDYEEYVVDMVHCLMSCFAVIVEDGKFVCRERRYQGVSNMPGLWFAQCRIMLGRLDGKLPAHYHLFGEDLRISLYSEVYAIYQQIKASEKAKREADAAHKIYKSFCDAEFLKCGFNKEDLERSFANAKTHNFAPVYFNRMVEAERELHERRENQEDMFDELFGSHDIGFEYHAVPNQAFSSCTIIYQVLHALCLGTGKSVETGWRNWIKQPVTILLCGDQITNRAPILEDITGVMGWKIAMSRDSKAKVGKDVILFDDLEKWIEFAQSRQEVVVIYWVGLAKVKIVDNIPTPPEGTDDDKAVIQLIRHYSKHIAPTKKAQILVVHHDVMRSAKLSAELTHLRTHASNAMLSFIPHPASDSKSIAWVVAPRVEENVVFLKPGPLEVWGKKMLECTAAIHATAVSVGIGKPKYRPSALVCVPAIKFAMHLVQWQRFKSRAAGKKIHSEDTLNQMNDLYSLEFGENPTFLEEIPVTSPSHKKTKVNSGKGVESAPSREEMIKLLVDNPTQWPLDAFCHGNQDTLSVKMGLMTDRLLQKFVKLLGDNQKSKEWKDLLDTADTLYTKQMIME